ncbi:ABC transporter ATP-binding protein [Lihuaxuella thermophila]|uniref:ABC-2 type transport system ATP-binding protein n=1 Tax=Lihuaxuella thermophila TaxID=1173111 RepID=A0A1H8FS93_9BACL|nr:ABC transporter ATP-binding protein [Lihuaxuella thermophila]SEN34127.1 ABC-2 type transport system ATP-binding protein [Lihuaxuella thermophila]
MLSVQNLTGGYAAHQPVIHDVSLEVRPFEIVGLIGLNGAGKSTTIKQILGLLVPQKGTVTLDGKLLSEDPFFFRSKMAFIPELPHFYEELTLWEHLELTARAYRLPREVFQERAEHLLETFRLKKAANWFPNTFSKGMQQKIMILCALLVQPSYLIVDEPFVGLDPLAIQALLKMLKDGKERGMGILMSTHILEMAEKYCDRFVILHDGRVKLRGTLAEMRRETGDPDASLEELFIQVVKG